MAELSIKVNIANRIYPLTIDIEEEELIRKAAKLINEQVKEHHNNYATRDMQDLLAMAALEYTTKMLELEQNGTAPVKENNIANRLSAASDMLNQHLKDI